MTRYDTDGGIPTLAVALSEHMNADELKVLATLTKTGAPARKAELVEHICKYLERASGSRRFERDGQRLGARQRAALALDAPRAV